MNDIELKRLLNQIVSKNQCKVSGEDVLDLMKYVWLTDEEHNYVEVI